MRNKAQDLVIQVLEWVWVHPRAEFEITVDKRRRYFRLTFYDSRNRPSYVQIGEERYWSSFKLCNVENLETLLGALAEYDRSNESQSSGGSNEV